MGCACREGYNLFNKHGRGAFKKAIGARWFRTAWKYMLQDTFGPWKCKLRGKHDAYDCSDNGDGSEWACKCCGRFVAKETGEVG